MNEFKPGDVVAHPEYGRGIVQEKGWVGFAGHDEALTDIAADLRRLVVIDPEDHEEVERLQEIASRRADDVPYDNKPGDYTRAMQTALREFANPKPPKPEEPTGLGAIVEDSRGYKWVRITHHGGSMWRRAVHGERFHYNYAHIDAVRVISEGVQP